MDMAVDFVTGVWVDAVDVATVGVGSGLTGVDVAWVVGKGWTITLTLYLLFAGTLALLFLSATLDPGAFLLMGCYFWEGPWCLFVAGSGAVGFWVEAWVWDQVCPPIPNRFSSYGARRGRDRCLCSRGCNLLFVLSCPSRMC